MKRAENSDALLPPLQMAAALEPRHSSFGFRTHIIRVVTPNVLFLQEKSED